MLILISIIYAIIVMALTLLEFLCLRGFCRFLAQAMVNGFGNGLPETEKIKYRFWISVMIFLVIVLIAWKLMILLLYANTLLPMAILKVLF